MENQAGKNPSSIHAGHRDRLRKKIIEGTFHSVEDHELLEALLFYAIPRRDTNEIAHALLDEFKTFPRVLEASPEELCRVSGISTSTAAFFRIVLNVCHSYYESMSSNVREFKSLRIAGEYGLSLFVGETCEVCYALLLDNSLCKLGCIEIGRGSVNSAKIDFRKLAGAISSSNASYVILYHNHPHGQRIPSQEDLAFTYELENFLSQINVGLLEHILVAANSHYPIMLKQKGKSRFIGSEATIESFYASED